MRKTGNTPFYFETLDVKLEGDLLLSDAAVKYTPPAGNRRTGRSGLDHGRRRTSADVGQQDMTDTVSDLEKELITLLETMRTSVLAESLEQLEAMWPVFWNQRWKVLYGCRVYRRIYWIWNCSGTESRRKSRQILHINFRKRRFRSFWHFLISCRGKARGILRIISYHVGQRTVDGVLIRNLESYWNA